MMSKIRRHIDGYNFIGDTETGLTSRWGNTFSENPAIGPWPELADISISNYCTQSCEYCYRKSNSQGTSISVKDYKFILEQLTSTSYGAVFQVALGGGEPLLHPDIVEILRCTREEFNIIPNYTTSGLFFSQNNLDATNKYCGAIAISYDPYRRNMDIDRLSQLGELLKLNRIKANIHYVVSGTTISDAIKLLEGNYDKYLENYNAIVFLTYKPTGRAKRDECLNYSEKLIRFLKLTEEPETKLKFGFDACFVPTLFKFTKLDFDLLDSCECGFFSVYIDEHLNVMPCSFCNQDSYSFNLRSYAFSYIWEKGFEAYRRKIIKNCSRECKMSFECRGKCEFFKELFFCDSL